MQCLGPIAGPHQVLDSLVAIPRLAEVEGQRFMIVRMLRLQRRSDAGVQRPAPLRRQALDHGGGDQGMRERRSAALRRPAAGG